MIGLTPPCHGQTWSSVRLAGPDGPGMAVRRPGDEVTEMMRRTGAGDAPDRRGRAKLVSNFPDSLPRKQVGKGVTTVLPGAVSLSRHARDYMLAAAVQWLIY